MKNKIVKYWQVVGMMLSIGVAAVVGFPFALAQSQPLPPPAPQSQNQLQTVLCNVTGYFFWIVILISVIMVLFAAFTYVTARDDQEKTSRARRTLTYAAIGIIVALIAYGFPAIIAGFTPAGTLNFQCKTS
jgi:cytochrome bd-type quinol oxidase subunit 2